MKYDAETIEKRRTRNNRIRKMVYLILVVLVYNVILILASLINDAEIPAVFGYKAYVISSESMKPNINDGDIVIIKQILVNEINIGDIITFNRDGEIITHRVVGVKERDGETYYTTKGDNNNIEDSNDVAYSQVIGKKILQIPYLGEIMLKLSNQVIIILVIFAMIFFILYTKNADKKKKNRREKKKIEDKKSKNIEENNK